MVPPTSCQRCKPLRSARLTSTEAPVSSGGSKQLHFSGAVPGVGDDMQWPCCLKFAAEAVQLIMSTWVSSTSHWWHSCCMVQAAQHGLQQLQQLQQQWTAIPWQKQTSHPAVGIRGQQRKLSAIWSCKICPACVRLFGGPGAAAARGIEALSRNGLLA